MKPIPLLDESHCFQSIINQHHTIPSLAKNIALCLKNLCQSTQVHVFLYIGDPAHLKNVFSSNQQPPKTIETPKSNEITFINDNQFVFPIHYENNLIGFMLFEDYHLPKLKSNLDSLKALYAVIGTKFFALIEQQKYCNEKRIVSEHLIHFELSEHGLITDVSDAMLNTLGYTKQELLGSSPNQLIIGDQETEFNPLNTDEIQLRKKNGETIWVKSTLVPYMDFLGETDGQMCLQENITEQKIIEQMVIKDDLTQLYNRRFFNQIFDIEIDRAIRAKSTLAFMICDIDNFKKYNDTYGHPEGDQILYTIAQTIQSCYKRKGDYVFRIGGEEFGVICNITHHEDAEVLADLARQAVEDLQIDHTGNPHKVVTISTGIFILDPTDKIHHQEIDALEVYKAADIALYKAKKTGRNKVVTAGETDDIELF